ncbi:TolC family protein [Algoriphagus sp. Y33]|uniref:TolC family protein n=1 Tax=Algoriphagus sp. Y33 TaxID=2772483 RepID=UPI00177F698A|nr:TolC family protein [Algoriphagus sp. Y33]
MNKFKSGFLCVLLLLISVGGVCAQEMLTIKEAVDIAVTNYGAIQAKGYYAASSVALADKAKREYLPDFTLSAQQDYGTVNGIISPLWGFGGYGVASSGLPRSEQNWDAAFGASYVANINWEVFSFGRASRRILTAEAVADQDQKDLTQEIFQHQVKVASAYLDGVAAHKLTVTFEKNMERAATFQQIVKAKARNGLIAGVDSSQADAEFSNAKIAYLKSLDRELEAQNTLMNLIGVESREYTLDTLFLSRVPQEFVADTVISDHPLLEWYRARVNVNEQQTAYFRTFNYPSIALIGIMQTRASGFGPTYNLDNTDFSHSYWDGINPTRSNYLVGVGLTWNLSRILRTSKQVQSQKFVNAALLEEYRQAELQIRLQGDLSDKKLQNALESVNEAPIQVAAASQAYQRQLALYENGLTDLVNVTQTLYLLIRAETDMAIANNNVWQALLFKAAAAGDYSLFEDQL